jgi:hypothetical protein
LIEWWGGFDRQTGCWNKLGFVCDTCLLIRFALIDLIMNTRCRLVLALAGGLVLSSSLVSCVSPYGYYGPNQSVGGVLGAGAGALAGAVIGNQSGRPLEGAAIGGALGAVAGSAIGNAQDRVVYGNPAPYYGQAPVVYQPYYQPAPVIVQRRYVSTGFGWGGGGWNNGWGGGFGGGWGGGGYCAPPPCW